MKLELIGYNKLREQDLYILEADSFDNFPRIIQLSSKYFITLVVCDCVNSNIVDISNLMKILLDNGARYFIGWGPNSTLIDDLADWEVIADGRFEDKDKLIMTAWIDDESIKEANFFCIQLCFSKGNF